MEEKITTLNHHSDNRHSEYDVGSLNPTTTSNCISSAANCKHENSTSPSESKSSNHHSVLKYEVNEKVYVNESSQVYLAKVVKTRFRTLDTPRSKKRKRVSLKEQLIQEEIKRDGPFWEYYIHFNGWSARHDKWCRDDVIMKDNEVSRELATISVERQRLEDMKRKEKKISSKMGNRKISHKSIQSKDDKLDSSFSNRSDSRISRETENELLYPNRFSDKTLFEEYCTLPLTLQRILIDDQHKITKLGRHVAMGHDNIQYVTSNGLSQLVVHSLPVDANITVESILRAFVKSKLRKSVTKTNNEELVKAYNQFCDDILHLFEVALPKFLLYPQERKQYMLLWDKAIKQRECKPESQFNDCATMAKVYGGEFLLRFLVRLPQFMTFMNQTCTDITRFNWMGTLIAKWRLYYEKDFQRLGGLIHELILFLQKNRYTCFKGKYRIFTIHRK